MSSRTPSALLLFLLLTLAVISLADSPPSNTIPVISMKTGQHSTCEDITMDVLLDLIWHNFDGIWIEGRFTDDSSAYETAVLCDSAKAYIVLNPAVLSSLYWWPDLRWGRYSEEALSDSCAYIKPNSTYSAISDSSTAEEMADLIETRCATLYSGVSSHPSIWYLEVFDEASAKQLSAMLDDSSSIDDYFPSLYTQDTMMTQMLPDGIFSWIKYKADSTFTAASVYCPTVSTNYSMMHTIDSLEWAGFGGISIGNDTTQANCVRAYFEMQYLRYDPESPPGDTISNTPDRLSADAYPVRMAGYYWQTVTEDSITVLGSATDLWMLDHYEQLLDSTFIPAGSHEDGPFTVNYVPQSFGRSGGEAIWKIVASPAPDTTINYNPYAYRIPSPAEFRMLCNIGLLRGARGVFPFCITSYDSWKNDTLKAHNAGLLDENLIPFNDPYENWVYRDRHVSDYWYAPPDLIPPWTAADSSQFDPLYTLPLRPTTTGAKAVEDYLEWKFAAYGRLWYSVRETFGQIARIAPELSQLWWWFDNDIYDNAEISYDGGTIPEYFAEPHIRVFTDSTESICYLFYMNRFCRANDNPFEITVDTDSFPNGTDLSEYALDHSRRFLVEGSESSGVYTFLDTLDAGEARLLQMFDDTEGLDADLRVTDPDVFVVIPLDGDTLTDNAAPAGTGFDIYAWIYNMGTESENNVKVYLEDITTDTVRIDSVSLNFNGLSTASCYQTDRALVSFDTTITPGAADIGVNIYRIHVSPVHGEPDTLDNSASVVYMVRPRDYATTVLEDPWDMSAPTPPVSPPAWYTFDIDSLTGCWDSYTDSISGMFEGNLSSPSSDNALYLNTGSGRDDWIDADIYHNFSLAGRSQLQINIEVHWMDSDSSTYFVDIQEDLTATAADIGPVDLSSLNANWTSDVITFWLEFSGTPITSNVRIGWVKLTE